jgi:hypothetical protein
VEPGAMWVEPGAMWVEPGAMWVMGATPSRFEHDFLARRPQSVLSGALDEHRADRVSDYVI